MLFLSKQFLDREKPTISPKLYSNIIVGRELSDEFLWRAKGLKILQDSWGNISRSSYESSPCKLSEAMGALLLCQKQGSLQRRGLGGLAAMGCVFGFSKRVGEKQLGLRSVEQFQTLRASHKVFCIFVLKKHFQFST